MSHHITHGGTKEAIAQGAGALVPAGDPAALAAAVLHRLADRARADHEGQVGRTHVERHHDLARTLAGVDRAYSLVLSAPPTKAREVSR